VTGSGVQAEQQFVCSRCGEPAGTVLLRAADTGFEIVRSSFTSVLTRPVTASASALVRRAMLEKDAAALYMMDFELAPFYCPDCGACYCGAHWLRQDVFDDDGWHDSIRGTCPAGHERMLED
jgi:hypothetical protein